MEPIYTFKRADSSRVHRLSQLRCEQRLLLSGTPVQNNVAELLTLLSFMHPETFPRMLAEAFAPSAAAGKGRVAGAILPPAQIRRVRRMLAPFVLRRCKRDVLAQLPPKAEEDVLLPMTPAQQRRHAQVLGCARQLRRGDGRPLAQKAAVSLFFELRKASNHPCLLRDHYKDGQLGAIADAALAFEHFGGQATRKHIHMHMQMHMRIQIHIPIHLGGQATRKQVLAELGSYSDFALHHVCLAIPPLKKLCLPPGKLFDSAKFARLRGLLPARCSYAGAGGTAIE